MFPASAKDSVIVTDLNASHHPSFFELLLETHQYYHPDTAHTVQDSQHYFERVIQGETDRFRIFVACDSPNRVVGMAVVYFSISFDTLIPERASQMQLKELFVSEHARGIGVGTRLMRHLMAVARQRHCARLDLNVRTWNRRGIKFYESLGACVVEDRLSMRVLF